MDVTALRDQQAAVRAESMQLRADATRLRIRMHRSADQVLAATQAALTATASMNALLESAQISAATARPGFRDAQVERLKARLATLPVIEQAKGILIARQGCDSEQAFDILRRASQRSNRPVRELALELVAANTGRANGRPLRPLPAREPRGAPSATLPTTFNE